MNTRKNTIKTAKTFAFTALFFSLMLSSCAPVYRTNTLFMPAFENKGDVVAEASLGTGDLNVNAGYAITENLAVIAAYQNRGLEHKPMSSYFFEMGLGWYASQQEKISSEIMASLGYGQLDYYKRYKPLFSDSYREQFINTNYLRSAAQYNIHFHARPLTFSLGSRFAYAHFNDFEDLIIREHNNSVVSHNTARNFSRIYLEPMGTVTINVNQVSVFVQSGFVFLWRGDSDIFNHESFSLHFGIRYRMNRLMR